MARDYAAEFPERPLMSTLSDLLGIAHYTTSRGSTVRSDYLLAVAEAIGVDPSRTFRKDDLIRAIWEKANGSTMPDARLSNGGTVTNQVLQDIIDGVTKLRRNGEQDGNSRSEPIETKDLFDPLNSRDERASAVREVAVREGQDPFRRAVLEAYESKCAVTATNVPAALEAAHIVPYLGKWTNVVQNGLCLRRDIHAVFDRRMLAVDERTMRILLAPALMSSSYAALSGRRLNLPRRASDHPSTEALRAHRESTGLVTT